MTDYYYDEDEKAESLCTDCSVDTTPFPIRSGTWEWYMYKGTDATAPKVYFISDDNSFTNSYGIGLLADESLAFIENPGGGTPFYTNTSFVNVGQWYKITVHL